ncbi:glycosyltransferase [Autumnicola musiva]|uniref:Glycosyltransferase family 2 protein n=1 Tax=Autumnicola musiva TaxID=3075589 RepID=A0ABU3D715_9FLAO|nr:glycosyltransferase family 2 protein [Zunongwangia sp. F117]MDT0677150.1 glycosyltransferase family 2 protein [Zunongwangia sp. F117]
MRIYIVIPAHNEAEFIGQTLESLVQQSKIPEKIVVVDDNSTDGTTKIVDSFIRRHPFISLIKISSEAAHLPGSKVINAFNKGYKKLDENYDLICKFDADLVFPKNYLEKVASHFEASAKTGICGGFCSVYEKESWVLENLTGKDHLRGALKTYRKECFLEIGKLKSAMGWDTVDELLAQYHGWEVKTDKSLLVKHLKPTGKNYNKSSKFKQGEAFYRLHYGLLLTAIASAKMTLKKKNLQFFLDSLGGYFKAKKEKQPFLVSEEEGCFIRNLRWKNIRKKLF